MISRWYIRRHICKFVLNWTRFLRLLSALLNQFIQHELSRIYARAISPICFGRNHDWPSVCWYPTKILCCYVFFPCIEVGAKGVWSTTETNGFNGKSGCSTWSKSIIPTYTKVICLDKFKLFFTTILFVRSIWRDERCSADGIKNGRNNNQRSHHWCRYKGAAACMDLWSLKDPPHFHRLVYKTVHYKLRK